MGVSFLKSSEFSENKDSKSEIITKNVYNGYRNGAIYKECSYLKCVKNKPIIKDSKIPKYPENGQVKSERYDKFSWTKIYRSPLPRRYSNNDKIMDQANSSIKISDTERNKGEHYANVLKVTAQTSMSSFIKPKSKKIKCSKILPKCFCPCCCGGEDRLQAFEIPYNNQSTTDSYESIDLNRNSITSIPINIDASLMSMIYLQRNQEQRFAEIYTKILKSIVRNAYRNFLYIFASKTDASDKNCPEFTNATVL